MIIVRVQHWATVVHYNFIIAPLHST